MLIFVPYGSETSQRKIPFVTLAIIAVNFLVYLFLPGSELKKLEKEAEKLVRRADWIVLNNLAVQYPELGQEREKHEDSLVFLDVYYAGNKETLAVEPKLRNAIEEVLGAFHALKTENPYYRYAYIPAHPSLTAMVAHMFIHGGVLHILFNMLFLWVAGCVLEDSWGRVFYGLFYFLCGFAAIGAHHLMFPMSQSGCIGASGAVSEPGAQPIARIGVRRTA